MVFKRLHTPFYERPIGKALQDYDKYRNHRFVNRFHSVIILILYEVILMLSWDPDVLKYNAIDIWFVLLHSYIQFGTLLFSLFFIITFSKHLYYDYFGLKDGKERKKDREDKKKKEKEGKKDWKPEKKKPFQLNLWYLFPITFAEAFLWAFLIFALLRYVVFGFLVISLDEIHIQTALDGVWTLKDYHTNPFQDLAIALGAGFYEEYIFRGLLFMLLVFLAGQFKRFSQFKINLKDVPGIPLRYPEYKRKDNKWVTTMLWATLIYGLSSYVLPFSDVPNIYTFLYRCAFGFLMYLIFVYRGWSILIWTHALYVILYFLFV